VILNAQEASMGGTRVERRLAAILAADVAGYSRLMGVDEVATLGALKAHRAALIDHKIAEHNGRIVKTTGDGLLVEFPSVVDAVRCAVEWQEGMAARNADVPREQRLSFRIGVNLGDVILEAGDVYGDGVNIAARLEQLADAGGICISRAAYEQVRDKLPYRFRDDGEHSVKNISRPIHVWRLGEGRAKRPLRSWPRRRKLVMGASAALLAVVAAVAAWFAVPLRADQPPSLGVPSLSIVVLPFANLSGDKDQDYLADALTDDITTDLSRISGSFVISSSTAATFKGKANDPKRVAGELNVRYVLDGSVRQVGTDVRVEVELTDGITGQEVWFDRYDRNTRTIYAFQSEVTGRVARALNLKLREAVSHRAARSNATNLDAEDYASRAWVEIWARPQSKLTNDAALDDVAKALAIDPNNSEALGVEAYAYARAAQYGWFTPRDKAIRLGIAAGEKSVEVDAKNADAFYALGFLYRLTGDAAKSQEMMRQCIALDPNHAPAYFFYGQNLLLLGRPRDARAWVERAFALSPRDPLRSVFYSAIARAWLMEGDNAQAIDAARSGVAANPDHPINYLVLAAAFAFENQTDESKSALGEYLRRQPGMTIGRLKKILAADVPAYVKAYDRLWTGLRKSGMPD
jgi:adenylate cyclase